MNSALFCGERVAVTADKIVRCQHVGLLFRDHLPNRQRKILVESVSVGLFGGVFPVLSGLKQSVVSAPQLCFQVSPDAMDGSGGGAGLLDVMNAVLVKHL